jgi:hypothetical protein
MVSDSSPAQTWAGASSGSWSDPGRWVGGVAPVSSPNTNLAFIGSGTESYVAHNDLGAFSLNSRTFNNTGTGSIQLTGDAIQTNPAADAVVNVNLSGTGPVPMGMP